MSEAVLWLAGGALVGFVGLVCFTAWLGLLDDDSKVRRDLKHRGHHKWTGQ
jgi:hypothetical protein